jgi:hypothetical protein
MAQQMRQVIGYMAQSPALVARILRDRTAHFRQTRQRETLPGTIASLGFVTVTGFAALGFAMGLSGGSVVQALSSALKLPTLFLVAGLASLPAFYQFSTLSGSRLCLLQTIAMLLTSQGISATLALGFVPIVLLFWISGADPDVLVALNLVALGSSTAVGMVFFLQGVPYAQEAEPPDRITMPTWIGMFFHKTPCSFVLAIWLVIYALVGAQLGWALRPFFGVPGEPFLLLREEGRAFFDSVLAALR